MLSDEDFYARYDLSSLKHIFSVGEPLNPKVIDWSRSVLNKEIYDTWFQTETGAIMIANRPEMPVKPGSMGKAALPEIKPAILSKGNNCLEPPNNVGNLCIEKGWSSMFLTYLNNAGTYDGKFINGYYYTGDEAKMDADGYFWFIGRSDDVINTAGHLISPFEIESAMLEVPEVLEAAAVAVPDEILFEAIVVFAKVKEDVGDVEELKLKIRLFLSNRLSTVATPKDVVIIESIPKNKSGKIMRRVLKAGYLGTTAGDTSTIEDF